MMETVFHRTQFTLVSISRHILFLCLLLLVNTAEGTSVLGVNVADALNKCEFVFEGQVISIESRVTNNGSSIHTYVVFNIIDIIKGVYHSNEIELSFAGGTVDGMTLKVSGMHLPKAGEKGIYFVESLTRTQVHPFYGWSQGHLLVVKDTAGIERIATQQKQAVMAMEPVIRRKQPRLSSGVADGLVLEEGKASYAGMSKSQFVQKLRGMLKQP